MSKLRSDAKTDIDCLDWASGLMGPHCFSRFVGSPGKAFADEMERMKVGDPGEVAENALSFCGPNRFDHGFGCQMISGPFDHPIFWSTFSKFLGKFTRLWRMSFNGLESLDRARKWHGKDGQRNQHFRGCRGRRPFRRLGWHGPSVGPNCCPPTNGQPSSEKDRRTLIRWWGGSGEALWVILDAIEHGKRAGPKQINRKCLKRFGGCSALCELLPGTTSVLDERGEGYGGCVGDSSGELPSESWTDLQLVGLSTFTKDQVGASLSNSGRYIGECNNAVAAEKFNTGL